MKKNLYANRFAAVVLAGGEGVRMHSETPKVLHQLAHKPIIEWVLNAVSCTAIHSIILVIGNSRERIRQFVKTLPVARYVHYAIQKQQRGSAHALLQAMPALRRSGRHHCLVVCGDTPLLDAETLGDIMTHHIDHRNAATLLSTHMSNPFGYGRIVRNLKSEMVSVVEERDASPEQRALTEINTGVYCFETSVLARLLKKVKPNNVKKEYYLTDVIDLIRQTGGRVDALCKPDSEQFMGINTRVQLAQAYAVLRKKLINRIMHNGVTVIDPETVYIDPEVTVGSDTIIYPGVHCRGKTHIGSRCSIGPNTLITDSVVESGVSIRSSYIYASRIRAHTAIGPFAHVRPGSDIGPEVKIGNFVEVKQSRLRTGVKAGHLAYLGDADVHEKVNVGAGVITCNYDGRQKHKTVIGKQCFVGTNVSLVAPVTLGNNSFIAAGSTITDHVPAKKLAIARSRQINKTWSYRPRTGRKNK
ncbi:MAG: bifunctional UDP-N-acetylglucosamine diphosphorylase/glucosamine-1-phosphate N-acetyltransferase GlmU [Elusimicrobia bacterium]|nr:bifunctional UDP-N-acetylglucosamine diphosphorylase/glucosamine-1-phosphate N-acetyltransferase GlmU [Elusimicrobiota bacterium]MBD3412750.1 bifunctional UDP-N-acetylglucosamine diphosphorylase/glucosamine-1-phosphate N-acetyltransferase GlmU [Elusimicrobiota bacterium]